MSQNLVIEAVLFDVDGVVVESEFLHLKTFNEALAQFGIIITEDDWRRRFVGKGSVFIMETLFDEHDVNEDVDHWVNYRRQLYRQHVADGDLRPIAGFQPFYNSIHEARLPVAFVSTGHPANIAAALGLFGLEGKHPIIDSTQVTRLKPDPEAYILGAQSLHVFPQQCLVFEDSPIGVAAAKAAEMTCVALTTTNSPEDLEAADLIIPNFEGHSIQTILVQLNRSLARRE